MYVNNEFQTLVRKSYCFKQGDYERDNRWRVLENLYNTNFLNLSYAENIPKRIHQIWLGSKPIPEQYRAWMKTWQKFHPGWDYRLWTDEDMDEVDMNYTVFYSIRNMGQRSDYLRYHLLNQFGGVYVDTDFECLKSLDDLTSLKFFTGVGYPSKPELYIGLIGSMVNHPIIRTITNGMTTILQDGWKNIFDTTGSYYFTEKFFSVVAEYMEGVVALPHDYFYPFPNNLRKIGDPVKWIKDISYAIHYWEVSWNQK